jgi:hypothetical protein
MFLHMWYGRAQPDSIAFHSSRPQFVMTLTTRTVWNFSANDGFYGHEGGDILYLLWAVRGITNCGGEPRNAHHIRGHVERFHIFCGWQDQELCKSRNRDVILAKRS